MPFGANDLSLFAAADAAIRAWIADAPLPPRDKAPVDYFLVEESIIKREGNLRLISRPTLKLHRAPGGI
jgi:succinylglutamate desuccinylase